MAVAVVAATRAAHRGDVVSVVGVGVVVFLTVWRTFVPLETRRGGLDLRGLYDVTVVSGAVIVTDASLALVWSLAATLFALVAPAILHRRAADQGDPRTRRARLTRTYDLLRAVHESVTSLTVSLDPGRVVESIRSDLRAGFEPGVVCLLEREGRSGVWVPRIAEGCVLRPSYPTEQLPGAIRAVAIDGTSRRRDDVAGDGVSPRSRSGLYATLRAGDEVVGLVALEHPHADRWSAGDLGRLEGHLEEMALLIADARWLARLRSYGVDDERSRIEGDLQDRLGQWLTYVGFELDAIHTEDTAEAGASIARLRAEVDGALREVRDTVGRLEAAVSTHRSFATAGSDLAAQFNGRNGTTITFEADPGAERLDVSVEQELLAILAEALTNIEEHAAADTVHITWSVNGGTATLRIADDGSGFDVAASVRDRTSGLVAMRGRADAIGARLDLRSRPGEGTTILVEVRTQRWLDESPSTDQLFDTRITTR